MQSVAGWRPTKALEGVRVADFTRNVGGAYATRLMGELGADVMKIEAPHEGDMIRHLPPEDYAEHLVGGVFIQMNCSKRGLSLDLRRPEAKEIVFELVRVSDVVTENFLPGTMDRLGLGYETLSRINPSIIMCSVSGYGQYGPYRDRRANENEIEASAGVMDMTGDPDGPPQSLAEAFCDTTTALYAFGSVCAALRYRELTGVGQHLDVAMQDCVVAVNNQSIFRYLQSGGQVKPTRRGRLFYQMAVRGIFRGQDGWIFIGATSNEAFGRLCQTMGRPDLNTPETFGIRESRTDVSKTPELYAIVEAWVQTFASVEEVASLLRANRIPTNRVRTIEEVVNEENTKVRGLLSTIELPGLGQVTAQNTAVKFSRTPAAIQRVPPRIGEHTIEILGELLGYDPQRIARLFRDEVIWAEPQFQEEIRRPL